MPQASCVWVKLKKQTNSKKITLKILTMRSVLRRWNIAAGSLHAYTLRGSFSSDSPLSHVGTDGFPQMVDISKKENSVRSAHAQTSLVIPDNLKLTFSDDKDNIEVTSKKGPVFATAILAGIQGAKKTSELIPLCHPIPLDDCDIKLSYFGTSTPARIVVDCIVRTSSKTGVEMEALTGATTAALCVYDMCKALSHDIIIAETKLISKIGGKGGNFIRTKL